MQGPQKKFTPVTGFDLLSKTGNAYVARKDDPEKTWQKAAYTDPEDTVKQQSGAAAATAVTASA